MMSENANQLVRQAADDGLLDEQTARSIQIDDLGEEIQRGLCPDIDGIEASEVVLVAMLIDDSGSIRFAGNSQVVRDGHNMVLEALAASKQKDNILVHTRYLNGEVLTPFTLVDQAPRMEAGNYNPNGGTPLYDQTMTFLATVAAQVQQFEDNGVPARGVTLILSDGADTASRRDAPDAARVTKNLLATENHIIAAMGIDDGGMTDFRQVFGEMAVPDDWILTPDNSEKELRRAFQLFSQSAVRASQGGAGFSQTAAGGFGG